MSCHRMLGGGAMKKDPVLNFANKHEEVVVTCAQCRCGRSCNGVLARRKTRSSVTHWVGNRFRRLVAVNASTTTRPSKPGVVVVDVETFAVPVQAVPIKTPRVQGVQNDAKCGGWTVNSPKIEGTTAAAKSIPESVSSLRRICASPCSSAEEVPELSPAIGTRGRAAIAHGSDWRPMSLL